MAQPVLASILPKKAVNRVAGSSGLVVAYFGQLSNPQLLNDWLYP
jgi:hypothetical protein